MHTFLLRKLGKFWKPKTCIAASMVAEPDPAFAGSFSETELRKACEEEQVFSELHSSWGTDNYVWVRKNWPPQMAIYKPLRLVGPAHTASNWMLYNLCEEQLQRFKYLTAKGARVEIFSLFCSKRCRKCLTGRGSPWTTARDLLVLTVGWRALGSRFTFGQGACCPH